MDWRDELVTSAAEAEAFLDRQIRGMGFPGVQIESCRQRGLTFDATLEGEDLLNFEIESNRTGCTWYSLHVGDKFRGQGLGLIAAKAALGVAFDAGLSSILLFSVRHDGPGFWSKLGGREDGLSDNYRIDLADPETHALLEKRLGRIPNFLPPSSARPFVRTRKAIAEPA
jgi:ribosomal protein S18 acetylase RimI-like enzyme